MATCRIYEAKEVNDAQFDAQLAKQELSGPLKIWVGKDYVNFIFKDFVELDNPFTGTFDNFPIATVRAS